MLAFITSLRHPETAGDYRHVEDLLRYTLRSVTRQTADDYVVIVVGNRRPAYALPERVHFVEVGFPPPPPPASSRREDRWEQLIRDKGSKLGVGLLAARRFSPDYVMFIDADDFVHREIAAWVSRQTSRAPGWYVADGWVYSGARGAARPIDDLYKVCGTCYIVRWDAYAVPADLGIDASQDEVLRAFGDRARYIMGKHRDADMWLADRGYRLERLPFAGAVYHVDTGENHSGKSLAVPERPMPRRVSAQFGIRHRHPYVVRWWRSLGPGAYPTLRAYLREDQVVFPLPRSTWRRTVTRFPAVRDLAVVIARTIRRARDSAKQWLRGTRRPL